VKSVQKENKVMEWRKKGGDDEKNKEDGVKVESNATKYGNDHFLNHVHFEYTNPAGLVKCEKNFDCEIREDPLHNLVFYHGIYNVRKTERAVMY